MSKTVYLTLVDSNYCSGFSVSHSPGVRTAAAHFIFNIKRLFVCSAEESQIGSWTFNILSPLQSKRLISHSAGLWLLTRTNSASCWLVTHTGTAMIGCLTPGGTPLIVCLAYFLRSFCWHILAPSPLHSIMQREQGDVIDVCVCLQVCVCVCVCLHVSQSVCLGETKSQIHQQAKPPSSPFPLFFIAPLFLFFFFPTAAQIR